MSAGAPGGSRRTPGFASAPTAPALKEASEFRLLGRRVPRIDGPAIVSGRAAFGLDVRLPGMLFAAVARCPVKGGALARADSSRARRLAGVRGVAPIDSGLAVLASDSATALAGRDALEVQWEAGANANLTTEELWRRIDEAAGRAGRVSRRE